ncbi:hypothetical protein Trydic_g2477 [Trypoxylus dichotomus]
MPVTKGQSGKIGFTLPTCIKEGGDDSINRKSYGEDWYSQVKKKLLSEKNQQELTEIRSMLQQISSDNHQLNETELNEWIDGDDDLLRLHSDDSVSNDEMVIDEPKMKHEEAIGNFNTLKWSEDNEIKE